MQLIAMFSIVRTISASGSMTIMSGTATPACLFQSLLASDGTLFRHYLQQQLRSDGHFTRERTSV